MTEIEQLAKRIATEAHKGQFRRDGITPYITHPESLASRVSEAAKPVAWLHDVLEDNPEYKPHTLLSAGLSQDIVFSIMILTKSGKARQHYFDYIKGVMRNSIAREVKIADIEHNLSSNPNPNQISKYKMALLLLKSDLVP